MQNPDRHSRSISPRPVSVARTRSKDPQPNAKNGDSSRKHDSVMWTSIDGKTSRSTWADTGTSTWPTKQLVRSSQAHSAVDVSSFQEALSCKLEDLARTITMHHLRELEEARHDARVQRDNVHVLQDELKRISIAAERNRTAGSTVLSNIHPVTLASELDSNGSESSVHQTCRKQDLSDLKNAGGSYESTAFQEKSLSLHRAKESRAVSVTCVEAFDITENEEELETTAVVPTPNTDQKKPNVKKSKVQVLDDEDSDNAGEPVVVGATAGESNMKRRVTATFAESEVEVKTIKAAGNSVYKDVTTTDSGHQRRMSLVRKISEQFHSACFEAYPVWYEEADPHASPLFAERRQKIPTAEDDGNETEDLDDEEELCLVFLMWKLTIPPNSLKRLMWDLLCISFNVYDIIVLPLAFFEMSGSSSEFLFQMSWVCRIFWTLDIPISFLTGYISKSGGIELHPKMIAYSYLTHWLFLDLCVVTVDWLEYFLNVFEAGGALRVGRSVRAVRMIRMLRLLRLVRMPQVFKRVTDRFITDRLVVVGHIVRVMFAIVGVSHIFACLWYGLGQDSRDARRWVDKVFSPDTDFSYRYSYSLHWTMATLTSGNVEISPKTVPELMFTVLFLLFAFALCAGALSSITSSMTRLHIMAGKEMTQFGVLRRYMSDNGISPRLFSRVMRASQQGLKEKQRLIAESDVELLQLVSEPLKMEIHFEIHSPLMCNHPFFRKYTEDNKAAVHMICHKALDMVGPLSHGDIVFHTGEIPYHPRMMFVLSGSFHYMNAMDGTFRVYQQGDWICEHTLWVPWRHCGEFRCASEGRLIALDAENFQQLVARFFSTTGNFEGTHPSKYALEFVKRLNDADPGSISDTTIERDILHDMDQAYPKVVRFRVNGESGAKNTLILIGGVELGNESLMYRFLTSLPCRRRRRRESSPEDVDTKALNTSSRRRATGAGMKQVGSGPRLTGMGLATKTESLESAEDVERTPTGGGNRVQVFFSNDDDDDDDSGSGPSREAS